jgi:hypothetical protein
MKKEGLMVAVYARCSTHDKGQDPELELLPLQEYCQRRGFTITGKYVDNEVSGTKDRRPQFDRLGRRPVPPIDIAKIIDAHKKTPSLSIRELAGKL